LEPAFKKLGLYNFIGVNKWESVLELAYCKVNRQDCVDIILAFTDTDPSVDNLDRFQEFLADFPAGSSLNDLVFFAQDIRTPTMKQFSYGEKENRKRYGSIEPPEIPLQDLRIPVALVSGSLDLLADPTDVFWLSR
jgi:hypothetical protein